MKPLANRNHLQGAHIPSSLLPITWCLGNRLLSCTKPSLTETYSYREDGLRASKTSAGSESKVVAASCSSNHANPGMIWDEQNMAIATGGSFNLLECQTNAPGEWGSLSYQMQDGYFTIPLFDAQGSTRWELSWLGNSFWFNLLNYDAFGNLISTPPAQPDPLKYIGQYGYYTDATGLNYVRNRYYDPVNGTWISRDPIGFAGGDWNLMRYVGNNPVADQDSSGLLSSAGYRPGDGDLVLGLFKSICDVVTKHAPYSQHRGDWQPACDCAKNTPIGLTSIDRLEGGGVFYTLQEQAVFTGCQADCLSDFCKSGVVYCDYSRTGNCSEGKSAAWSYGRKTNMPCDDKAGRAIYICMQNAFTGDRKWNTGYGCGNDKSKAQEARYPECNGNDCKGKEHIFYMLHELNHVCGPPAGGGLSGNTSGGTGERNTQQQACCLFNTFYKEWK